MSMHSWSTDQPLILSVPLSFIPSSFPQPHTHEMFLICPTMPEPAMEERQEEGVA